MAAASRTAAVLCHSGRISRAHYLRIVWFTRVLYSLRAPLVTGQCLRKAAFYHGMSLHMFVSDRDGMSDYVSAVQSFQAVVTTL